MKINLSDRKLFLYLPTVIYTRRDGLGEFETIMQTQDAVKDLHHFLELSQPIVWLVRRVCSDKAEFSFLQKETAF